MPDANSSKTQLRTALRQRRLALGPGEQRAAAEALLDSVTALPAWPAAQRIALYLAADGEIDTGALSGLGRDAGKQLFLPVIQPDDSLVFAAWEARDRLSANRYNIPEPPAGAARCPAADLDIIFLPLVGWDEQGGRLGMGGGFYDRTLTGQAGPVLVGLAHSAQQAPRIPRDDWDVLLDFVATDTALYRCQGAI